MSYGKKIAELFVKADILRSKWENLVRETIFTLNLK